MISGIIKKINYSPRKEINSVNSRLVEFSLAMRYNQFDK